MDTAGEQETGDDKQNRRQEKVKLNKVKQKKLIIDIKQEVFNINTEMRT